MEEKRVYIVLGEWRVAGELFIISQYLVRRCQGDCLESMIGGLSIELNIPITIRGFTEECD